MARRLEAVDSWCGVAKLQVSVLITGCTIGGLGFEAARVMHIVSGIPPVTLTGVSHLGDSQIRESRHYCRKQ